MILIGCRTDGDWKAGGWLFPIVLVLKKGDLWRFLQHIWNQTTLSLQATSDMPNTADTSDSDTDTPFPPDTAVSSFSGSGISWFENGHIPTNISICWLPDWFLNWSSRRRRRVLTDTHWQVKEVSTSSSIDYLTDLLTEMWIRLSTEKNRRVKGTGCVYFKSDKSIFTYGSIDRSIDLSMDSQNGWRDTSVGNQTLVHITWMIYQLKRGDTYRQTQIDRRAVSVSNPRH